MNFFDFIRNATQFLEIRTDDANASRPPASSSFIQRLFPYRSGFSRGRARRAASACCSSYRGSSPHDLEGARA